MENTKLIPLLVYLNSLKNAHVKLFIGQHLVKVKNVFTSLLLLFVFGTAFGQKQSLLQGHKIPELNAKGIPNNIVTRWWEDAAVYTVKNVNLNQPAGVNGRMLNASLEFIQVNFNEGLDFGQDSLYSLTFSDCTMNKVSLTDLKSRADLFFYRCTSIPLVAPVPLKTDTQRKIVAMDDIGWFIAGNHFRDASFKHCEMNCGLLSSDNVYRQLTISSGHIPGIEMKTDSVSDQALIQNLHMDSVYIEDSYLHSLNIVKTMIKGNLSLLNCTLLSNSYWTGTMGGKLAITGFNISKSAELNLTGLKPLIAGSRIDLYTDGKNFNQINLVYRDFHLRFADRMSYQDRETIYSLLLDNFTARHQEENRILLDKEFQSFRYRRIWFVGPLVDNIICVWWDYGYARGRVFLCTLLLLTFFSFVNYWLFEQLNSKVYQLDNFAPNFAGINFLSKVASKLYYSFIYTAVIFLKVSVKFEKLFYDNKALLAWFFFIYITGFFCIFFIINAIFKF